MDIANCESVAATRARRDCIFVSDYVVNVEVGAFQEERGTTQALKFFVGAELSDTIHANDDVDSIVSYDTLTSAIGLSLAEGRADLLETLAERIARHVLSAALVDETTVRIEKLDRISGTLGVEIVRTRMDVSHTVATRPAEYTIEEISSAPDANTLRAAKRAVS